MGDAAAEICLAGPLSSGMGSDAREGRKHREVHMSIDALELGDQRLAYVTVVIGGVKTACVSHADLAKLMIFDCQAARRRQRAPRLVFDVNGHALSLAAINSEYRRCLEAADLIHADGQPIVAASKLLTSTPIPERTATTDFFHVAASEASEARVKRAMPKRMRGRRPNWSESFPQIGTKTVAESM